MRIRGLLWAKNCIRPIKQHIERIDNLNLAESIKITLRTTTGILPALLGSLLAFRLTPIFVMASILLTYLAVKPIQQRLFELSVKQRYWHISVPVNLFFIAWALILSMIGEASQISRSVGAMVMVSAVGLWPVYMGQKAYQQKRRKVPFKAVYAAISTIVIFQQILIIGEGIHYE